jgi:hypothetical protein
MCKVMGDFEALCRQCDAHILERWVMNGNHPVKILPNLNISPVRLISVCNPYGYWFLADLLKIQFVPEAALAGF